jgi:murein DD-endopeptidase MepM/ murein hydrolase activator NlpD
MRSTRAFLFLFLIGVLLFHFSAFAQRGPGRFTKGGKASDRKGQIPMPSGLKAVFPDQADCIRISSPFGSRTRYDGSLRPENRYGGRHGGMDLSLDEGTPLLAIAGGTVLTKGEGDQMEGFYIWLLHPPEQTGLSYWVYTKYQHLRSLPEIAIGKEVALGQVIGYSGKTGTMGGHYGINGYPHLHLSTMKGSNGDIQIKNGGMLSPDLVNTDPLVIYHDAASQSRGSILSETGDRSVSIPYMTSDGRFCPQGTRVVWPVACQPRQH